METNKNEQQNAVDYKQLYEELKSREESKKEVFDSIVSAENNDITRENANMNADTPAGMMMKFASETSKEYVNEHLLSKDVLEYMNKNYLYIHDRDYYPTRSLTCVQSPIDKVFEEGFIAGHASIRPPKRIESAAMLACISLECTQNTQHGGQSIPAFDFYMAPFVRLAFQEELKNIGYDDFRCLDMPVKPGNEEFCKAVEELL